MITQRIYQWARSLPTKVALISNDVPFSYADFARAIEAARSFFARQNLPVNHTAIVLPGGLDESWVFIMALRALGLNTACVETGDQALTLNLKDLAAIIISSGHPEAPKLNGGRLTGTNIIKVPGDLFYNIRTGDLPSPLDHAPPFGGHILLTSGTTGTYKKILLYGRYEDGRNAARANVYPLNKNMIYHVGKLAAWTAVGFGLPSAAWHTGASVVMDTRGDAVKNFFRYRIDLSILTPAALKELLQSNSRGANHEDCELLVTSGFLPLEVAQQTARQLTKKIGISYGSTELATPSLLSRHSPDPEMYWLSPTPNRVVRVTDENGVDCAPGQEGELRIALMEIDCKSYLDDDDATGKMFRGGFFCPGDMAVSRADGRVRIIGRTADVLNVQGKKIAVAPLEMDFRRILHVEEVCLFSGLNAAGQEELVVAIEADMELPRSACEQVAREFTSFAGVRFVYFKQFPRTTGARKVHRLALRKLILPQ